MAFKPVGTSATDIKLHEGKQFTGFFIGIQEITTTRGNQFIFQFKEPEGEIFGVYGFTHLNNQFMKRDVEKKTWDKSVLKIEIGKMVRVTYTGKKAIKNNFGKDEIHTALVEVDHDVPKNEEVPF